MFNSFMKIIVTHDLSLRISDESIINRSQCPISRDTMGEA